MIYVTKVKKSSTTMKMSICFLIILFGVAAADKPTSRPVVTSKPQTYRPEPKPVVTSKPQTYRPVASRYGEPKPVVTSKPQTYRPVASRYGTPKPVVTSKPQAYRPVVFKKIPVIETTTPGNGGKFADLKETIHSKLRKIKPFVLGFKAGAILL